MFTKDQPFLASIKWRETLTAPHSDKLTQHIVLDIRHSDLSYEVGDCLGVYPHHDPQLVRETIDAMKGDGEQPIEDNRKGDTVSLHHFLSHRRNITSGSKKIVEYLLSLQTNPAKREFLQEILAVRDKTKLYTARTLKILFEEHPEVTPDIQTVCQMLPPLLPRFYSIASSQRMHRDEVHLTVGMVRYEEEGEEKMGVCTQYLCQLAQEGKATVPIYIHKHRGFTVPENPQAPMVMIGPGTGIAPFRGFMQERIASGASGPHWLFFGERTRAGEFYYREFWEKLVAENRLKLDIAFSRDQREKVYVQHRMRENGPELFRWIQNGAYVYVCGDAKRMAKDVEATLLEIFETQGGMEKEKALAFLSTLRHEGRYLRDVY